MNESFLTGPFLEFDFMRQALLGCIALSLGAAPVGVFLMLRRMSLMGDAMAHAILPGAATGYLLFGLSLAAMTVGGIVAGLAVAIGSGLVARNTLIREDTSLAVFYLLSLSLGVLIVSVRGNNVDLLHVLFGTVLALDDAALALLWGISGVTLSTLFLLRRALILECLDPSFLRQVSGLSPAAHYGFLMMLVINLVAGFHTLGTLMAVGIMVMPAASARFWVREVGPMVLSAIGIALTASFAGLLVSYHTDWPTSPAIVLCLGMVYLLSLAVAPRGVLRQRHITHRHLRA